MRNNKEAKAQMYIGESFRAGEYGRQETIRWFSKTKEVYARNEVEAILTESLQLRAGVRSYSL